MSQPIVEEVESFLTALRYGMKVSHKPEFLIALAEGWLKTQEKDKDQCDHFWMTQNSPGTTYDTCMRCGIDRPQPYK